VSSRRPFIGLLIDNGVKSNAELVISDQCIFYKTDTLEASCQALFEDEKGTKVPAG
jgi:hypothetical protein